ncbi:MAG: cyanophycin synthetase [Alphaproteobacteria bacterium]|nr:cyanophycin synthetase [Alphaproteobacteria bacterium]
MRILDTSVYRGPNIYALFPMIRHLVDIGILEEWPTGRLGEGFIGPLLETLPGLHEHGCSYGEPGGFVRRLRDEEGTWMGHVWEHAAIELQNVAGAEVSFGKTRGAGEAGVYNMVYEYEQEEVGLQAGQLALDLIHHLLPQDLVDEDLRRPDFVFDEERDAFIRFAQRRALGPSTASLVKAARERDIPWIRLNAQSLVQLGHGRFQRRIQATVTSETHHIAVELASDKEETNRILADLGLPVPKQRLVYGAEDAVRAAGRIGYPVVVKPLNANHGRGISIGVADAEAVGAAFEHAQSNNRSSQAVIIESFIQGLDHRMLVVNGELIAVSKRVPGHVIGDGTQTVKELVAEVNSDPRRGVGHEKVLTRIELDRQANQMLEKLGYTKDSVPPAGEVVHLRSTANLSTGGTAIDVTDIVHPDNRDMAVRAVKAVGLDVGGVDFLCSDISKSFKETGAAICEVNAAPGFRMHVAPSEGQSRDVAGPVMDMLFPPGMPSRIPIATITGTNGKTTTARMVAHIFKMSGNTVGLATTDGVYIDGNLTVKGDMTGPVAAQMILRDPSIDAAVLESARGGLLRRGLGYERCDVGAVLNIAADHLGLKGIETLEDMAKVKRIVVEVAKNTAVLNADDELCLKMAEHTEAENLCYITMNATHPLVREHVRAGGRAVVLEQGMNGHMVTIYDNGAHIPLMWTHLIPATLEGRAMFNVQNAMCAVAIAYSLDQNLEDIRHGLRTFTTSYFQAPGRMNVFDEHPFKVILDYGHNPSAMAAMCRLVEQLDPPGRRICVVALPGDRRDEDIVEAARTLAGVFDHYICRRDDNTRGRGPDEVPQIMRRALIENGVAESAIEVIPEEEKAVATALEMAEAGDLVLIFGDNIGRSWKQIIYFNRPHENGEDEVEATASAVAEAVPDPLADARPVVDAPEVPDLARIGSLQLVRDKRGVRLAVEPEEAD